MIVIRIPVLYTHYSARLAPPLLTAFFAGDDFLIILKNLFYYVNKFFAFKKSQKQHLAQLAISLLKSIKYKTYDLILNHLTCFFFLLAFPLFGGGNKTPPIKSSILKFPLTGFINLP